MLLEPGHTHGSSIGYTPKPHSSVLGTLVRRRQEYAFLRFIMSKSPPGARKPPRKERNRKRERKKKCYLHSTMSSSLLFHSSEYSIVIFVAAAVRHGLIVEFIVVVRS